MEERRVEPGDVADDQRPAIGMTGATLVNRVPQALGSEVVACPGPEFTGDDQQDRLTVIDQFHQPCPESGAVRLFFSKSRFRCVSSRSPLTAFLKSS